MNVDLRQCDFAEGSCRSWIGLREVAYRTSDGTTHGPRVVCAAHRRWLSVHAVTEWLDLDRLRVISEEEQLALRDEQDAEDIIDSDGRLLPRGLR